MMTVCDRCGMRRGNVCASIQCKRTPKFSARQPLPRSELEQQRHEFMALCERTLELLEGYCCPACFSIDSERLHTDLKSTLTRVRGE